MPGRGAPEYANASNEHVANDSQLLPQMEMAHDSIFDDYVEEIIGKH